MTGNNDGQGVFAQSLPDGPHRFRLLNLLRHPFVAPGLTVRDKPGGLPYLALKSGGGGEVKLVREVHFATGIVSPEAFRQVLEALRGQFGLFQANAKSLLSFRSRG